MFYTTFLLLQAVEVWYLLNTTFFKNILMLAH